MSDAPILRRHWHPIGPADSVGDAPTAHRLLGTDVVVWRSGSMLRAAIDRCPHRMARLSTGAVIDGCLECPYHAWTFGSDGRAVSIPQLDPGTPVPPSARLSMVHLEVRHGLIWLALDEPIVPIPRLAEAEDPTYRLIFSFDQVWRAAAPWVADNAIDIAHVNVVHAATIGDPNARWLAPYEVVLTEHGFIARLRLSVSGVAAQSGADGEITERTMEVEVLGPFTTRVAIRYPGGTEHVLFIIASPIDDESCRYIQLLARNDGEVDAPAAELLALDRLVVAEDRALCETLPIDFPIDPRNVVSVRADRITVEYRRHLGRLCAPS